LSWTKAEIEALDVDEAEWYFDRLQTERKREAEKFKRR
jgi:hypothetical protein